MAQQPEPTLTNVLLGSCSANLISSSGFLMVLNVGRHNRLHEVCEDKPKTTVSKQLVDIYKRKLEEARLRAEELASERKPLFERHPLPWRIEDLSRSGIRYGYEEAEKTRAEVIDAAGNNVTSGDPYEAISWELAELIVETANARKK